MHDIERRIVDLLEKGHLVDIESLGGIDVIISNWNEIACSSIADLFLAALILDQAAETFPNGNDITDLFRAVISKNDNPLVVRNTSLLVCKNANKLIELFASLLNLSGGTGNSFIRGHYLLAAFQISLLEKSKQYVLIGFLLEVRVGGDEAFSQYVVKIMGLGYAFFNNEDLFTALDQFGNTLEDSEEFCFEMGLANLKKAISSDRPDHIREFMNSALIFFNKESLKNREDAFCFAQLITLLLDFSNGKATENISERIDNIRMHLIRYHAYNRYKPEIAWASTRETEMHAWYSMCDKICSLSDNLRDLGWLNPVLIIEDYLLDIYQGQRGLLQIGQEGGIDHLIRPEIVKRISPLREKISLLEQWMAANSKSFRIETASQLVKEIERYKTGQFWGNDSGTVSIGLEDAVPAIAKLNDLENAYFEKFKESKQDEATSRVEKTVIASFEKILATLDINGFREDIEIWNGFSSILFNSLIYLEHRMNATVKNFPKLGFLFKDVNVHESVLQDDYFDFMNGRILTCKVTTERMDIAGGRSDVFFEFADFFIVTEIKRSTTKNDLEGYEMKYIEQTLAYQGTSAKLGFLFVLDLSKSTGGIGALESNVKLTLNESEEGMKRGVVIMRMPGNRIAPSKIKK